MKAFKDLGTKLYCLFVGVVLPLFDKFNTLLQQDDPAIHMLHDSMRQLMRQLLMTFVKPAVLHETTELLDIEYHDPENHKEGPEVFIGAPTKVFVREEEMEDFLFDQRAKV